MKEGSISPSAEQPHAPAVSAVAPKGVARIDWLDGVRGCSAVYVMLHHIYLFMFPGFPVNWGPWALGWLMYGHIAVVIFIVVSGFSLGLAPARRRNSLKDGASTFWIRRAWRILPPYWIALLLSLSIHHFLLADAVNLAANLRTFIVYGMLLQDIVPSVSPNSAFWSIAIEAQIYIVFPLLLVLSRAHSSRLMAVAVLVFVCIAQWAAAHVHPLAQIHRFVPQLLVAFAFGVWAAEEVSSPKPRFREWPLTWIAAGMAAALIGVCAVVGIVEVSRSYFTVDLIAAFIVAMAFVGFAETWSRFAHFLGSRPLRFLGQFSYSLYLIHAPLIALILAYWDPPQFDDPVLTYAVAALVIAPAVTAASYLFFLAFERPYLTIRSWAQFRAWITWSGLSMNDEARPDRLEPPIDGRGKSRSPSATGAE